MDALAEALKGLTVDSTLNDFAYYNSDKNDTRGDPKSDPLIATHTSDRKKRNVTDADTTNGNSPQKLLINRSIPNIIPPIDPLFTNGVAADRGTMHAPHTPNSKLIVTYAAHSGARISWTPGDVIRMSRDGTTTWDGNPSLRPPRLNYPVLIGAGTTIFPARTGSQDIVIPKGPTGTVEVRNTQIFHTSIHGDFTNNGYPTLTFSKVIGRELSHNSRADIYSRCRVNFMRNDVGTKSPNFMSLGIPAVHASDELSSLGTPSTRLGRPKGGSNWSAPGHFLAKLKRLE